MNRTEKQTIVHDLSARLKSARTVYVTDFAGLNVYSRLFVRHDKNVPLLEAVVDRDLRVPGSRYSAYGWEVYWRRASVGQ